ncbi:MAG: hypothetical protein JJT96_11450 [Opitutales bacterium]|nr:hypothetical protein [Opitutales bacterium]
MTAPLRLLIDDRKRNTVLLALLREMEDLAVECTRLEVGDFQIGDALVIERKTAADFAASLIDGRLFSQASRLVRSPLRPAYIIEGTPAEWAALKVRRPALQGALISLMLIFDIPVLRANDPAETARLVRYTAQQLHRAQDDGYVPTRLIKAKRRSTRQRRLLQALPSIGPTTAQKIVGTIEAPPPAPTTTKIPLSFPDHLPFRIHFHLGLPLAQNSMLFL